MPTQCLKQILRGKRWFRNNGWTKWEAVQLADELEAKQAIAKCPLRVLEEIRGMIQTNLQTFFV